MNVIDSSGWIEYLQDTPRAELYAAAIEDRARLLVPTISLFEVHRILSRALSAELVETCLNIMRRGRVLDLTDNRAIAASRAATRHGLAFADAAIYSIALEHGATLWTQDVDYAGLPGVNYRAKA